MSITETTSKRRLVQKLGRGLGSLYVYGRADGSLVYLHIHHQDGKQREVKLAATNLTAARRGTELRDRIALANPARRTRDTTRVQRADTVVANQVQTVLDPRMVSA